MINKSSPLQSFKHSCISGMTYGSGTWIMQYIKNSGFDNFIIPTLSQLGSSGVNAYINMRIYDIFKRKIFSILEDKELSPNQKKEISNWISSGVCWIETFIVTYFTQELAKWDGSIELASIYALLTFVWLPTGYEKVMLEKRWKKYTEPISKKIKWILKQQKNT